MPKLRLSRKRYHGRRGSVWRLLLDKLTYSLRCPRRWELILFRCPPPSSGYCIKRVVGLPGETIQVCNGDVLVDGRRARKSLRELRQLAIGVHDARFPVADAFLPARWQSDTASSRWQVTEFGFRYSPSLNDNRNADPPVPDVDWLSYHHWRFRSPVDNGVEEGPVSDNYGYNQTISRQLNDVNDLMLSATIETTGDGTLSFLATSGVAEFVLHVEPKTGSGTLFQLGCPVDRFELGHEILADGGEVELALVDLRVLLAVDGQQLLAYDYGGRVGEQPPAVLESDLQLRGAGAPDRSRPVTRPFAIGAAGLTVRVANLRVLRDVFYTSDHVTGGCSPPEPVVLGDDELFVLGDNSPVSLDSRQAGGIAVISFDSLLGKPLKYPE